MFYLWRANPDSSAAIYVGRFENFKSAKEVVLGIASADNLKVVERRTDQGLQIIVKQHATTLEALTSAITFFITRTAQRPVIRPLDIKVGKRPLKPGETLLDGLSEAHHGLQNRSSANGRRG